MRECVDRFPTKSMAPIRIWRLQNRGFRLYSNLRSEFCNCAVGPWVSVAGRGTALARGNPAIRKEEARSVEGRSVARPQLIFLILILPSSLEHMPIRYGRFEMPKTLSKDESTATDTYAKFTAEPFEAGYGHTVGNSLRRVLLSSLEGAAITAVKITGAQHEFATLPSVVEDVTDIVLNLKKVKFKARRSRAQKTFAHYK